MAQLAVTRRGWENEHLATFLLSRISFMAHPITVADDVGSDFYCTLFVPRVVDEVEQLFPTNSFAIQVKSKPDKISATNKIDYLFGLELPFFVGVVDRSQLRLSIYSGEYLPLMFAHVGRPSALHLELVENLGSKGYEQDRHGGCTLRFPKVGEITAGDTPESLIGKSQAIGALCSRMQENISARVSSEYIFQLGSAEDQWAILAGPSSVKTFRRNFYLRLAEVFYNVVWILEHHPDQFNPQEFEIYNRFYNDLSTEVGQLPAVLKEIHTRVLAKLNSSPPTI